ncbi:MAG: cupin domain-containing protein [Caldilineaceae bacterium]
MPIIDHATVVGHAGTRSNIPIRKLVSTHIGAKQTEAWEQTMQPGDHIPLHYHDAEETVIFLSGRIEVVLGDETSQVEAPVTVFVPEGLYHSFRNRGDVPAHMLVFFPALNPAVIYPDGTRRYAGGDTHE